MSDFPDPTHRTLHDLSKARVDTAIEAYRQRQHDESAMYLSQMSDDVMGSIEPIHSRPISTRGYWLGWAVLLAVVAAICLAGYWMPTGGKP